MTNTAAATTDVESTFYYWLVASQYWHFDTAMARGRRPTSEEPAQCALLPARHAQAPADIPDGSIVEVDGTFYRWLAASQSWHFDTAVAQSRGAHTWQLSTT